MTLQKIYTDYNNNIRNNKLKTLKIMVILDNTRDKIVIVIITITTI